MPPISNMSRYNNKNKNNNNKTTSWIEVLFGKLTVTQLVKKMPHLLRNSNFIIVFTRARHRTLSWASWIQPTASYPVSPRTKWLLPFSSSDQRPFSSPLVPATCSAHLIARDFFPVLTRVTQFHSPLFFFLMALQPQLGPRPTSMKLSVFTSVF
jgi:uncharacterized Zn-finger protein